MPNHIYKFVIDGKTQEGYNKSLKHRPIIINTMNGTGKDIKHCLYYTGARIVMRGDNKFQAWKRVEHEGEKRKSWKSESI